MAKYDRKFTSFSQYDRFFIILEDFENNWIKKLEKMDYWKVIELLVKTAAGAKDKEDNFFYAFFIESYLYYYRKLTKEEEKYVRHDVFGALGDNDDAQTHYVDYVEYDIYNGGDYWKFDDVEEITLDDYWNYYYD